MASARSRAPRVAVVGDYMLDAYVSGAVRRVCPDSPAPVLEADSERYAPGGAGNVAVGCCIRGLEVVACGLTGADEHARVLETLLAENGVRLDGLVADDGRRTLVKRRFCVGEQILLRVDEGSLHVEDGRNDAAKIGSLLKQLDAVLVSDYGYGSVTPQALARLRPGSGRRPLLIVDAKDFERYRRLRPDVAKPNYDQLLRLLGVAGRADRVDHVFECGTEAMTATGAEAVVVTLDADGCVVLRDGRRPLHVPAPDGAVRATSGAGDTFLVALASTLLAGAALEDAARLATHAATSACRAVGAVAATVSHGPLAADRGKRVPPEQVAEWAEGVRREGRKLVLTNGCFDIFHAGHAEFLQAAARAGDMLLVAVNTDASVRRLKGSERPVNALEDRLRVLEAIGVVTAVTWFDDGTAARVVAQAKPDAYVKGSDYRGQSFPEADYVSRHGGRVVFVDLLEGRSTTDIVERVRGEVAAV